MGNGRLTVTTFVSMNLLKSATHQKTSHTHKIKKTTHQRKPTHEGSYEQRLRKDIQVTGTTTKATNTQ